jgi:hypothetical protein
MKNVDLLDVSLDVRDNVPPAIAEARRDKTSIDKMGSQVVELSEPGLTLARAVCYNVG